jgi:uncharacterized protein YecE (DUF72 family)
MKPELRIGTSGWNYGDWRGRFYPPDLPSKQYLGWYARHFRTVEVNYSFYHLPRPSTYENWAAQVPDGFVFAVKASRLITHIRRLEGAGEEWRKFLDNAAALGAKLGPILLQFPPSFKANADALGAFLSATPKPPHLAFEFRHASWFDPEILDTLRRHHAALVIADSERYPQAPAVPTAPFMYLRFHGPAELFASSYSDGQLSAWSRRIQAWLAQGLSVYAYFNNDFHGHALANARTLECLVGALRSTSSPEGYNQV